MSSSGWNRVRRRLAGLEREYGDFDVFEEETVVPRAVYTDCLQAAEAGSLGGARVVLRDDGEVLLVRYADHAEAWDFPGGSTERGESHEDTATFRTHEDVGAACTVTGVERVIEQSFALVENGDGVSGLWVFFEGEPDDRDLTLSEEVLEARWFDAADPPDAIGAHVAGILDA